MTRARTRLVQERVRHVQRAQKMLEDPNIKLSSFVSDIVGKSGRAMLDAIVAGETDPEALAKLAHPRLRASRAELVEALRGRPTPHHRAMLQLHLDQVDATDRATATIEGHMEAALGPFREARAPRSAHFERRDRGKIARGLVRHLKTLGCEVELPTAA